MHAVEGADCSVRSLRVQRARVQGERQRKREMVDTERMAAPRRGEGGFRARCSGQRGGLTGARVTGPHIGELSVPICLPAEKPGGVQGRRGRKGRGERDRTVKARENEGRQRSHAHTYAQEEREQEGEGVHSNQNVNYLTSR